MAAQALRYVTALAFSSLLASFIALPFAFGLDILWGEAVTGGRWSFTWPNTILMVVQGAITGLLAGQISGRNGTLMAVVAQFFPLAVFTLMSLVANRDLFSLTHLDTRPTLWIWIGLAPAMLLGSVGVKQRLSTILMGIGGMMAIIGQAGALVFHAYTVLVAYRALGIVSAFYTLSFPAIAEIVWAWCSKPTFWNTYTMRFVLLLAWGITAMAVLCLGVWFESRQEKAMANS